MSTSALAWLVATWIATELAMFWCGAAWGARRVRDEEAAAELRRVRREVSAAGAYVTRGRTPQGPRVPRPREGRQR